MGLLHLRIIILTALRGHMVRGHGTMSWPPNRAGMMMAKAGQCTFPKGAVDYYAADTEERGSCLWFNEGCQIGCASCTGFFPAGKNCTSPNPDGTWPLCALGDQPLCDNVMEPTLNDPSLRTFPDGKVKPAGKYNPWRAPGHAPVINSCGISGSWVTDMGWVGHAQGGSPPPGLGYGFAGTDLPESPKTTWIAGSTVEAAWTIWANHGGGYQYRLCPKDSAVGLTEKCFQMMPLMPATNVSYLQYGDDKSTRQPFPATRVTEGVMPQGSVWTKNPVAYAAGHTDISPSTLVDANGVPTDPNFFDPVFQPVLPELVGGGIGPECGTNIQFHDPAFKPAQPYGSCSKEDWDRVIKKYNFNIIDELLVPTDLTPGEYVLSFRWDCEQSPQIWSGCSDITVVTAATIIP